MALSSTIHQFAVQLSHVDRGVYEALELHGIAGPPLATLVTRLERRTAFELSVIEGVLYLTMDGEVVAGMVTKPDAIG